MADLNEERARRIAQMRDDAGRLAGLSLEDLGYEPHPDELTDDERAEYDAEDLAWLASVDPERREKSRQQAELLAGALWHASVTLIDNVFEDITDLYGTPHPSREQIEQTWVLSELPPRHAHRYTGLFARRFLVVAADATTRLADGWDYPSCVAQELAVRCLLNRVEVLEDLYELDLAEGWRAALEEVLLEDHDSELLYMASMDGIEDDPMLSSQLRLVSLRFDEWFDPFSDGAVAPYAAG